MRTQPFAYILLICLLFACKTNRQRVDSQPDVLSTANGAFPAIMIKEKGDTTSRPLGMRMLEVSVEVVGNIATTSLDMTFFNETNRVLEGQLYVPLGEGQTVSGFAMEVDGSMRAGVVVEKAKGRQVFENVVRQQIDPGLLEWTQGNNFRARVYPIPANGTKRIRISYQQELRPVKQGLLYLMPMNYPDPIRQFSLDIQVIRQELTPVPFQNELSNLTFTSLQDAWVARWEQRDYLAQQQLGFVIPQPENPWRVWVEETDEANYWYGLVPVEPEKRKKDIPEKITLLWDVSHSAASRNLEKELEVLDAYFQQIQTADIQLVTFAHQVIEHVNFDLENGKWNSLRKKLENLPYDGGTQLSSLDLTKYPCDEFILSSDGLSNLGKGEVKLANTPVMVMTSSQTADYSVLTYLAQKSGGEWINLNRNTKEEAIDLLTHESLRFLSIETNEGKVAEVYPSFSQPVSDYFSLAGIFTSSEASVTLNFGFGNKITQKKTVLIDKQKQQAASNVIARLWAQKKLAELDMQAEKNEQEMVALGKSHAVVSRFTSLIVLDGVEDYVENEIMPPPALREEYERQLSQLKEARRFELFSHMDQVAEAFLERKLWWETTFKIPEGNFVPDSIRPDNFDSRNDNDDWGAEPVEDAFERSNLDELSEEAPMAEEEKMAEEKPKEAKDTDDTDGKKIEVKVWNPDTPYMQELKSAPKDKRYATYLLLKASYAQTPAFFLDVSQFFFEEKETELGLRILSNIAELELENHELLRVLARRLEQLDYYDWAIPLFERIIEIREEEPQSFRDLALVLARDKQYQEAIEMMYEVVRKSWSERFPNIGVLAAHEMNVIIAQSPKKLDIGFIDPRLLAEMPTDMRVVLDWDADAVDMDLWVTDPRGEKCYYQNRETGIGGFMSNDFTGGYGPEEFLIRKAMKGTYKIQVNYYGTRQQRIAGPTNIQVKLITNYGRPNQKMEEITLRLSDESEVIEIGEIGI